jgi:hypothetical protein
MRLSVSKDWKVALLEWDFNYMYTSTGGTCLCTHSPITEHFVISNKHNANTTVVGSSCIEHIHNKELSTSSHLAASIVQRIRKNPAYKLTQEQLDFCVQRAIVHPLPMYQRFGRRRASNSKAFRTNQNEIITSTLSKAARTAKCQSCSQLVYLMTDPPSANIFCRTHEARHCPYTNELLRPALPRARICTMCEARVEAKWSKLKKVFYWSCYNHGSTPIWINCY